MGRCCCRPRVFAACDWGPFRIEPGPYPAWMAEFAALTLAGNVVIGEVQREDGEFIFRFAHPTLSTLHSFSLADYTFTETADLFSGIGGILSSIERMRVDSNGLVRLLTLAAGNGRYYTCETDGSNLTLITGATNPGWVTIGIDRYPTGITKDGYTLGSNSGPIALYQDGTHIADLDKFPGTVTATSRQCAPWGDLDILPDDTFVIAKRGVSYIAGASNFYALSAAWESEEETAAFIYGADGSFIDRIVWAPGTRPTADEGVHGITYDKYSNRIYLQGINGNSLYSCNWKQRTLEGPEVFADTPLFPAGFLMAFPITL